MLKNYQRREFLKVAGTAALAQALKAGEKITRIGFVGVGNRGTGLVKILLDLPSVQIPAICDINEEHLRNAQGLVEKSGRNRPEGYSNGPEDYRRMVTRDDLDAIVTATPWELHTPIAVAAMKAGKYAATEVPAAITIEQCWELVNTSEQSGMPFMMLENDCFGRGALMALNLVQAGVLGELIHCEGGYDHDLRAELLKNGELSWRGMHALRRNANLYPTHPIGPIAWWTGINRGDRFTYLTSMSSKSRGLNDYAKKQFGPENINATRRFADGDVNTSLIMTAKGVTITLNHDTQLPRPYSDSGDTKIPLMVQRLQGTNGIFFGSLEKIYIDGRSPLHKWEDTGPYYEQYEHFLWKALGEEAKSSSHGGEDYVELHQFVRAVRIKTQTPVDVYDAATWSAITALSEQSVASKSAPVDFPDFTRGKWKSSRPLNLGLD
ncbi:MAG: Gfo/Idh/MocA family protein [Bryobacteraceae bacterium]